MKKIFLGAFLAVAVINGAAIAKTTTVIAGVDLTKVGTIVKEITSSLSALNLTGTQTTAVSSALTNYVTKYNSLKAIASTAKGAAQLSSAKTSALTAIKSSLGASKYTSFLSSLKTTAVNQATSAAATAVINSLIK